MKSIKLILALLLLILVITPAGIFAKDPGDIVNDFTVKNFDGKEYKLSSALENGYVVVMFWSAECPYVQPFNDRINDYVNSYNGTGITFWAINSNVTESTERVKEHSVEHNYIFPVLKDDNSMVANLFEATRTPEVFVLNKDRKIMYHGRIDDNSYANKVTTHDLKNALDELVAGKEITTKSTKSFGCTIKRD